MGTQEKVVERGDNEEERSRKMRKNGPRIVYLYTSGHTHTHRKKALG